MRLCAASAALALGCGGDAVRELAPEAAPPAAEAAPTALAGCAELGPADPWWNQAFSDKSGIFHVEFDATPSGSAIDAVVGLGRGGASDYAQLAAIVRFNTAGTIDVRSGSTYRADAVRTYQAGVRHHFRIDVNTFGHVYSVWLRNSTGRYDALARGYAFRTEQSGLSIINTAASKVDPGDGGLEVCGVFAIADQSSADQCVVASAGDGFVSAPLPDATAVDTVTVTATPSAQGIDAVIGLSAGAAGSFNDLATAARFAPSGVLDARDGDGYRADVSDPYSVRAIDIRVIADLTSHTYSVFRGPWQEGRELARQYRFRTQQSAVTHLDHLALIVDGAQGSISVCLPGATPSVSVAYSREGAFAVVPLAGGEALLSSGATVTRVDAGGAPVAQLARPGPIAADGAGNMFASSLSGATLTVDKYDPNLQPLWTATASVPAGATLGGIHTEADGSVLANVFSLADHTVTVTRFSADGAPGAQLTVAGDAIALDGSEPIALRNDGTSLRVTRYDMAGQTIWTDLFTGQAGISTMTVDPNHNLVFGGELFSPMDFGGGTLQLHQTDDGKLNAFVVELSPAGAHVFSLRTGYTHIGGIATDGARVLVSGTQQTQFHYWHLQAFNAATGAATQGPGFNTGFGENGFGGRITIGPTGRIWWNLQTQWPLFPKWDYMVAIDP